MNKLQTCPCCYRETLDSVPSADFCDECGYYYYYW